MRHFRNLEAMNISNWPFVSVIGIHHVLTSFEYDKFLMYFKAIMLFNYFLLIRNYTLFRFIFILVIVNLFLSFSAFLFSFLFDINRLYLNFFLLWSYLNILYHFFNFRCCIYDILIRASFLYFSLFICLINHDITSQRFIFNQFGSILLIFHLIYFIDFVILIIVILRGRSDWCLFFLFNDCLCAKQSWITLLI